MKRRMVLVLILSFAFIIGSTTVNAADDQAIITSVNSIGCGSSGTSVNVYFPDFSGFAETFVWSGGQIYMDEYFSWSTTDSQWQWAFYNSDDRGLQTAPFPIPAGQPVYGMIVVHSPDGTPLSHTMIKIPDCEGEKYTLNGGPVTPLSDNHTFQSPGVSGQPVTDWTISNPDGIFDNSHCPGAGGGYESTCSFRLDNQNTSVSLIAKNVNTFTGGLPQSKRDLIRVEGWLWDNGATPNRGKVIGKVNLTNSTARTVKFNFGGSGSTWNYFASGFVSLRADVQKARVKIKLKPGDTESVFADTLALYLYENYYGTVITPAYIDSVAASAPLAMPSLSGLNGR